MLKVICQIIYAFNSNELVAAAVGTKSHGGVTYNTIAKNITGLMPAGSDGVNHGEFHSRNGVMMPDELVFHLRHRGRWNCGALDRFHTGFMNSGSNPPEMTQDVAYRLVLRAPIYTIVLPFHLSLVFHTNARTAWNQHTHRYC